MIEVCIKSNDIPMYYSRVWYLDISFIDFF